MHYFSRKFHSLANPLDDREDQSFLAHNKSLRQTVQLRIVVSGSGKKVFNRNGQQLG